MLPAPTTTWSINLLGQALLHLFISFYILFFDYPSPPTLIKMARSLAIFAMAMCALFAVASADDGCAFPVSFDACNDV
jgi:hypothetical protein